MADRPSERKDVYDVERVAQLVALMKEYDLSEIDLRQTGTRIRLRRGADPIVQTIAAAPAAAAPAAPVPAAPAATSDAPPPEPAASNLLEVKSPMVGTFYTSSSPDAEPFVKVGDLVSPDKIVCMVEAMKVFNEIPAEVAGTVVKVCVENGDPVEYGQVLFQVRPEGS